MTNKFTTPCFVRVEDGRDELIAWLEDVGYDCSTARADVEYYGKTEPVFMVVNGGDFRIQHNRPMLIEEHDCGTDIELFKALAAMNSKNDREQWFVAKCDINDHGAILWHERDLGLYDEVVEALRDLFRKATAEELINHFKGRTKSKTIETENAKHSLTKYHARCTNCGCDFWFTEDDCCAECLYDDSYNTYVNCPQCGCKVD